MCSLFRGWIYACIQPKVRLLLSGRSVKWMCDPLKRLWNVHSHAAYTLWEDTSTAARFNCTDLTQKRESGSHCLHQSTLPPSPPKDWCPTAVFSRISALKRKTLRHTINSVYAKQTLSKKGADLPEEKSTLTGAASSNQMMQHFSTHR